jgi:ACS family glucarate transporter-like MFS transporter
MQTAFFVCYALFQIPSGMLTEGWGHRRVIPLAVVWWSVFTSLTAFCGKFSTWIVVRGIFGIGESPVYPGLNGAFGNWFPRKERGGASAFLVTGSCIGQIIGMPLSVIILAKWGWRTVFVSYGVAGLAIAAAYYVLLRTHPRESKFVNAAELDYILEGKDSAPAKKGLAPWKTFFRSSQFWAVAVPAVAANFINYVFIAWLPVYLLEARHFSLKEMGMAAAFVFAGPAAGGMIGGFASDTFIRNRWSTSVVRAWFGGVGLLLCCCGLYMTAVSANRWLTLAWLSGSLFCMGVSFNASWASCTEIGGRFGGTVTGWMNFWGQLIGGGLGPILIAWIASRYDWQTAIITTAGMGIIGAISWIFVRPDLPLRDTN